MIKLTATLRRNPALTAEEFQQRWSGPHADLVREVAKPWLVRYVQRPPFGEPGHWAGSAGWDGVAELWFGAITDFEAFLADPAYLARVRPDEDAILDLGACTFVITEEPRILLDGEAL